MDPDDAPESPATLLERMLAAGIGEEKARGQIARGVVRVDGDHVTDPDTAVPWPQRWAVWPG